MSITGVGASNIAFKGAIKVPASGLDSFYELETSKILGMEERPNEVLIKYDIPVEKRHNGVYFYEPMKVSVNIDINTLLNAYNAAKNTDLIVDISEHNRK